MMPQIIALFSAPQIAFPGAEPTGLMVMRLIHFVAGITWVGLLYFFYLVGLPFMAGLDGKLRALVMPKLMLRALWWFRWSSVLTVLVGIAYWMHIVAQDRIHAGAAGVPASSGMMFGSFFGLWTLAFVIEMGLLMSPANALRKTAVFGALMAVVIIAVAYLFLSLNQTGWQSNRALAIGIGGGLGWFMMLNVWGVVWRMQKRIIQWTEANAASGGPMPPEIAKMAALSMLCTRLNFWLTFPMLFFMGAASHYFMFYPGQ